MVNTNFSGVLNILLALLGAPLLPGIINRVKAWFAGRQGPPLLQPYFDILKLLGKGAVYSRSTTWLIVGGPVIGLACLLTCLLMMPLGNQPAFLSFAGDVLLAFYLLGLLRFLTMLAALDTGSAFEGMGASREATFAALGEPSLFLSLGVLAVQTKSLSLTGIYHDISWSLWAGNGGIPGLVAVALLVIFLTENARIPVDDPNTHLELTMIHEVMVLDHGGPDLAMIFYGSALKLWILGSLITGLVLPFSGPWLYTIGVQILGLFALAVLTGVIESAMARLRLMKVCQFLLGGSTLALLAFLLLLR
jgi:formate hydrogenlyase subunit 4